MITRTSSVTNPQIPPNGEKLRCRPPNPPSLRSHSRRLHYPPFKFSIDYCSNISRSDKQRRRRRRRRSISVPSCAHFSPSRVSISQRWRNEWTILRTVLSPHRRHPSSLLQFHRIRPRNGLSEARMRRRVLILSLSLTHTHTHSVFRSSYSVQKKEARVRSFERQTLGSTCARLLLLLVSLSVSVSMFVCIVLMLVKQNRKPYNKRIKPNQPMHYDRLRAPEANIVSLFNE